MARLGVVVDGVVIQGEMRGRVLLEPHMCISVYQACHVGGSGEAEELVENRKHCL